MHLEIYDWGGHGAATLLAHPTGFHGRAWEPIARRLVDAGRQVWSFDFRGHGDSDRDPTGNYDWHGFIDDALSVTDTLGVSGDPGLVVAGHSMGGAALVGAEIARPGVFARIWTYEPVVIPADAFGEVTNDNPMSVAALRRRDVWDSREQAFEAYASKPPFDTFTDEALRAYVWGGFRQRPDGSFELKCRPVDEARIFAMTPSADVFARLDDVACPVLVVRGDPTRSPPAIVAPKVAAALRCGALHEEPRLGHFGPGEDPEWIAESILGFATN